MTSARRLVVIPNFIDDKDLLEIADLLDKAETKKINSLLGFGVENPSVIYDGENQRHITLPTGTIDPCDNYDLFQTLDRSVSRIKEEIEKSFRLKVYPESWYSVTTYVKGNGLIAHSDGAQKLSTPNGYSHRDISSVLYLNDNFVGGITSFDIQGIDIKPKAGTLILFPGTEPFMHSVSVLESGLRYIIPQFWSVKNV